MELHMWNVEAGMVWNAFAHIAELHGGMLRNDCLEHASALQDTPSWNNTCVFCLASKNIQNMLAHWPLQENPS
jgi:hypothetical protein